MVTNTPKHEEITGASLSGSSGDTDRTYTLTNSDSITPQLIIVVDGAILQNGLHFTKSSDTITFLKEIFDDQTITIDYFVQTDVTVAATSVYTTTLEIIRVSGIGVEVENETLGTGDGSEDSYDIDNGNIVAGSYTVKYGTADDNTLTALTETDDYTLNKNGGLIVLTSAGKTKVNGKVIYISYIHSPKMSDTILDSYLEKASREVDKKTGDTWGAVTSGTDYFDGEFNTYPRTERPYSDDYDEPFSVNLKNKSIQSITGAYELLRGMSISKAFRYDSTASSYTDVTSDMNSQGGTAFQPFADTTAAGDYLYIGTSNKFHSLNLILFTDGVTTSDNTIEYYDGSSWTAFTPTESTDDVLNIESGGKLSWDPLSSWTKVSVNSSSELYWIRIKSGGTYTTEAKIDNCYVGQDFVINQVIPLYNLNWDNDGYLDFGTYRPSNGKRNIRIDYTYGYSTTPPLIEELTSLIGAIMVYVNISGGSYDDATSFTLGRKAVSIGEVYVNIREVITQARNRINEILDEIGKKMVVI